MSNSPSGAQFEIAYGGQRVVITEVGAGLRTFTTDGGDVIDGYGAGEVCPSGRGQVLIPWPNRIEDGCYEFMGQRHRLAIDEVPANNAIHGLVRWEAWQAVDVQEAKVALRHVLWPRPGYPFTLALTIEYELNDEGLLVRTVAENVGTAPCPYGAGFHPYVKLPEPIDTASLRVPAQRVILSDARGLPQTSVSTAASPLDFRTRRNIGATKLDNAFYDLERDQSGLARVELWQADGASGVALWMDRTYGYVMVFSGDSLPDVHRRSLAVEPMTCPPNAFRTGEALIALQPGESLTSVWGISPLAA